MVARYYIAPDIQLAQEKPQAALAIFWHNAWVD